MFCRDLPFKHACSLIIVLLSITACKHSPPRVDTKGKPQREYTYQVPEKIDDGWQVSSLAKEGVNEETILDLMKTLLAGNFPKTHSILLVKDGKLILEEYFYGTKRDNLHYLASATKSITSILIGISVDKDFLTDIDHKISHWFKGFHNTKWISQQYNITIRHLLSMTAGIDWDENRSAADPKHDYYAMRRGGDWIRYVFNKKLVTPPGQKFNYNGGLSALLGEIIHRSSGINAEEFSETYLFNPLGISHYSWLKYNNGSINTGGGLLLRSRDMAKIGQVVLSDGKYNDERIVSEQWIRESTKNQASDKASPLGSGYGYQWWLGELLTEGQKIETVFAQGRGGQFIFVIPKANAIAVITSQLKDNGGGFFRPQIMMTEYIIPALCPQENLTRNIIIDPSILENYVGIYEDNWFNFKASVRIKDNKLIIDPRGFKKIELFASSKTEFHGMMEKIGNIYIKFPKHDNGKVDNLTMRIGFTNMLFERIK